MDIRRKIAVLRALADDPRTPEAERRAAAAAVAGWEARLTDEVGAPSAGPTQEATRPRALPAGPTGSIVLVLDRDVQPGHESSTALTRRGRGGSRHVMTMVEVTPEGEKRVLGRWSITMRLDWPEAASDYLGFFGEGPRAFRNERVATMTINVSGWTGAIRQMFNRSQIMSLFVETGELGMVYFGRAFIESFDESYEGGGWQASEISLVTLDEGAQIDLGADKPAAQPALAESASRQTLPEKAPLLALHEPGPDEDT